MVVYSNLKKFAVKAKKLYSQMCNNRVVVHKIVLNQKHKKLLKLMISGGYLYTRRLEKAGTPEMFYGVSYERDVSCGSGIS